MDNLEWRPIPGYEGFFIISEYGDVKSLPREIIKRDGRNFFMKEGKLINVFYDKNGYKRVALRNGINQKKFHVHRLVALSFLNRLDGRNVVNHIDNDKINNHYSNLEWVNYRENSCHGSRSRNKSSKYIGVSYINSKKKFVASICIKNVDINLGTYKTEEEAYDARCEYERKHNIVNKYL